MTYHFKLTVTTTTTIILSWAGVAELADAEDLKSSGAILVGSSPSPGTTKCISKVDVSYAADLTYPLEWDNIKRWKG